MKKQSYLVGLGLIALTLGNPVWAQNQAITKPETPVTAKPKPAITGQGIIKAIDVKNRQVTLQHDAIPALQWPAMTMAFPVAKDVALDKVKVGEAVTVDLQKQADEQVIITGIKPQK